MSLIAKILQRQERDRFQQLTLWTKETILVPRVGQSYLVSYGDAVGNETTRRITVLDADEIYLWAHCHLRDAERCFRLDRLHVISCLTGSSGTLSRWSA